jgi:CPA1 family monovalent cation:H+ antiporter
MRPEIILVLLFVVATAVAIVARRLRVPYTVALVVAGLVLGVLHAFEPPHLTKELLFAVFLPGLLFEAAFHIDFKEFWQNRRAVTSLAVPGVIAAVALTTVILTPVVDALDFVDGFTWRHALVFGALIAATDPIAVVALFKSLGVPKRLGLLVEGESLLNDGTAIVFFTLVLAYVAGGTVSAAGIVRDFVTIVGAGALIGAVIGLAASHVIRLIDDPMLEITLTTIAAYGSFVAAEHFHYSGVIATVVAGLLCGNYAARTGMSPTTRVAVETFWEYVAFALNSIVFLLIGFEVRLDALLASWQAILVAFLAATIGRGVVVAVVSALLSRTRERIPRSWVPVLSWGGLRGGLSMVLVLGLPATFPFRDLLITMTFGVVVLSILLQGLTMAPLLRRLGVVRAHATREAYERARGELQVANAALAELEGMSRTRLTSDDVAAEIRAGYEARIRRAESAIRALHLERHELRDEEAHRTLRHLLLLEKDQLRSALRTGVIGDEAYGTLVADADARLVRLESGEEPARTLASPDPAGDGAGEPRPARATASEAARPE